MTRILFIDDEPSVLDGLRRMLRPMRGEWDMAFAQSGHEALDTLATKRFDVVISDMRMPGMDGAELLTKVMRQYPHIIRIALSGHSQKEMLLRSAGPTHVYLAKPCDADVLKHAIARAVRLRDLLAEESLQSLATQMRSIPSLPELYTEIVEELQNENASMRRIGQIISKDVGMTAKILQLVNSAFFGLRRHVSNPAQAVSLLGLETIKALVLSIHVLSQFDRANAGGFCVDRFWKHSVRTGVLASRIAKECGLDAKGADYAMTAGLLHDTGKLVLAASLPERYREVLESADAQGIAEWEAEDQSLGASHAELGAYLLGLWALPNTIVEALAFHHCPSNCLENAFSPLTAVHVANVLEHEEHAEDKGAGHLDADYLSRIGVADRLAAWRDICREVVQAGENR